MRWTRRNEQEQERQAAASTWHEGAHWVAGAGVVVKAKRAGELVAEQTNQAA